MSEDNVEIVQRAFAASADSGIEAVLPFYAEDIVLYSVPEWPDDSEYHGHEGAMKLERQWTENFDEFGFEVQALHDAGDSVVATTEMVGRIKGTRDPVTQRIGMLSWDFQDGRIRRVRYFTSWALALEAAGLHEQAAHERE